MGIIAGITVIAGNEKFSGFATTPHPLPKLSWKSSA
jgi:hypothetical protein